MLTQQQNQARQLYVSTTLGTAQIAQHLGIAQRTVQHWAATGGWHHLRASAQALPTSIINKCYQLLNRYLDTFLADFEDNPTVDISKQVRCIHNLSRTIKSLRITPSAPEQIEQLTDFVSHIATTNQALAAQVAPHIYQYAELQTAAAQPAPPSASSQPATPAPKQSPAPQAAPPSVAPTATTATTTPPDAQPLSKKETEEALQFLSMLIASQHEANQADIQQSTQPSTQENANNRKDQNHNSLITKPKAA